MTVHPGFHVDFQGRSAAGIPVPLLLWLGHLLTSPCRSDAVTPTWLRCRYRSNLGLHASHDTYDTKGCVDATVIGTPVTLAGRIEEPSVGCAHRGMTDRGLVMLSLPGVSIFPLGLLGHATVFFNIDCAVVMIYNASPHVAGRRRALRGVV